MTFTGAFHRIAPHVQVTTLEPHAVNVGLVVGSKRAALIDAGSNPSQGRELLDLARREAGVPVTHVVVTHAHHDHWFGVGGMTDIVAIAHEDLLADPEEEVADAAAAIGLEELPEPNETLSLVKGLELGGVRLEILHFGPAHTRTDLFVIVPDEDVIFVGDVIESAGDPCFSAVSNLDGWPKVIDAVLGSSTEATRFVPGHGDVVDRDFVFRQRAQIAMVRGTVEQLVGRGVACEEALGAAQWPFSEQTMATLLPLAYREVQAAGVRRRLPLV